MKENLKLGFVLCIITAVAGIFLGIANELTKDVIAMNSRVKVEDLAYTLPEADALNKLDIIAEKGIVSEVYEALAGSDIKGYVFKVSPKGYADKIDMLVGIKEDNSIGGIKILSQAETPGLGAKIEEQEFQNQFKGLDGSNEIKAVKNTPSNESEVEAISGATISSNTVTKGVNEAINFYKENILGHEVSDRYILDLEKLGLKGDLEHIDIPMQDNIKKVSKVIHEDTQNGHVIYVEEKGKNDGLNFAVGISIDGIITGIQVLFHDETPGYSEKIEDEEFQNSFVGISANDEFSIADSISGATVNVSEYGEVVSVDHISGATLSSMAIIKGVTSALSFFNQNLK